MTAIAATTPKTFRELSVGDEFEFQDSGLRYYKTGKITYRLCSEKINYVVDTSGSCIKFIRHW